MVFNKIRISTLFILLSLIVLYFLTRLTNIMSLPIFTDEAIYVRWGQIARQDAAWRFISLTDGKQPLFIWISMNIMRVVSDPLLASRLVSVFAGFGAMIGVFMLSMELFKKKRSGSVANQIFGQLLESKTIGYIAALFFIVFPFALVMDRMAMYDALVAFTMVWALYMEVLLVRYMRLDVAILTGVAIGLAVLTKTSGFFAIYLLPFSLLLFNFKEKQIMSRLARWFIYALIASAVAYLMYSVLRLSPFFYIIDEKNGLFVYPFSEWIKHPREYLYGNFNAIIGWYIKYVTVPFLIFALAAFFIGKNFREKLLLFVWSMAPFVALGIFGKTLYPRFIYFMTVPAIILGSYAVCMFMQRFKNKFISVLIVLLAASFMIFADYFIIFKFTHAPIPQADLGQYINSWPAGGGVNQMVSFFEQEAKKGKIYVATQGTFGSLPTNAMEIYLGDNPNIETRGIYPLPSELPEDLKQMAKVIPVYYVFNDYEDAPESWPVTLVAKYQKGIGDRNLSIYKVNP